MYVVKTSEQTCCTCDHWTGTRVKEEDGFVYSLKNLEGICGGIKRVVDGAEFRRALTFPNTTCNSWERWPELNS